jgi:hypothetical protein
MVDFFSAAAVSLEDSLPCLDDAREPPPPLSNAILLVLVEFLVVAGCPPIRLVSSSLEDLVEDVFYFNV